MLRTAKTAKLHARTIGAIYTSTSGTPVASQGNDDLSSFTDNGAGDASLNLREPFARTPVVVATAGADVDATSGAFANVTAQSASAVRVKTIANDGTATDGAAHVLTYGWDSAQTDNAAWLQAVENTGMSPRLIPISMSDPSTLVEGKYLADVSAVGGVSTITFRKAFQRAPVVIAVSDTAACLVNVVSTAVNKCVVTQFNAGGAAIQAGVQLLALGWDSSNRIGKLRRALKVPQMKPRVIAANITVTAGTPAVTGYNDVTVTDAGVGDYTLTFAKPFRRKPVVVACHSGSGSAAVTATSTTACTVKCRTDAGAAVDPTTVGVIIVGFDNEQAM